MMSAWRSNTGSLLPTAATMVSMGNRVTETSLVWQNLYPTRYLSYPCSSLWLKGMDSTPPTLGVFERKVLSKIFGPARVGDDFRIRFSSELYELLNDIDVVQRINIQRLHWLGICRSYGGGCSGEAGMWCGALRKSAKRTTLYSLERPKRGSPVIDWCNQLARKKQSHMEGCVAAGRNPLIGLLWPIK